MESTHRRTLLTSRLDVEFGPEKDIKGWVKALDDQLLAASFFATK
jgi:hypothetical protein